MKVKTIKLTDGWAPVGYPMREDRANQRHRVKLLTV